jgi:hypothetical protein
MADETTPLAAAFRDVVGSQTVLIERFYQTPNGIGDSGTGVIIGSGARLGFEHINIATAAHVLADPDPPQRIRWCVSRVEQRVANQVGVHVAEFTTEKPIGAEPTIYRPADPEAFDIGMISMINVSKIQGQSNEFKYPFIDLAEYPSLLTTPPGGHLLAGTEVAWCGFPGFVHDMIGVYKLCYYEGVVSAYASGPSQPLYLVDGHVAYGVSGGPIWFCAPDGKPVVLGVVSSYASPSTNVPGLCAFTPMNVLFDHLQRDRPDIYKPKEGTQRTSDVEKP